MPLYLGYHTPRPDPSYLPLAPAENFAADPSGNIMKARNLWEEARNYDGISPERIAIGKELFQIQDEEQYQICTIAFAGIQRGIFINRNNVKNQPYYESREHFGGHGWVYYFEDGIDNLNHPDNKSKYSQSVSFVGGN